MRLIAFGTLIVLLVTGGVVAPGAAAPEPTTEEEKTLYALGLALSQGLAQLSLSAAELELVKVGLTDGILRQPPKVDLQAYGPKIRQLQEARVATIAAAEKKAGQAFLDKAAGEQGATKTTSGLVIFAMKPGTGDTPKATDHVRVHYHGTRIDGTVFDSSVRAGEPVTFALNRVIPCWTEGLQLMKVGGKSRLVCPSGLAYGDRGAPPRIKPGATLVFEVELLDIVQPE